MREFRKELRAQMEELGIEPEFARRYLNDGFSGGEKKRMEILQLAMLRPKFAVLDETDSGLDSDAVRVVSEGLARLAGPEMGILIITHHEHLLEFNKPHHTHVMLAGRIVETGDAALAHELHAHGYGARPRASSRRGRSRKRQPSKKRSRRPPGDKPEPKSAADVDRRRQASRNRNEGRLTALGDAVVATDLKTDVGVGDYQYGFHDPTDQYVFKSRKGIDEQIVRQISEMKSEPAWMTEFRLEALEDLLPEADADLGRQPGRTQFSGHLLLRAGFRRAGARLERRARRHPQDVRPPGHSRSREEVSGRRQGPVRIGSRLRQLEGRPGEQGRDLHRHRLGAQGPSRPVPRVFRDDHSVDRQQVRRAQFGRLVGRLVHLRAQGREDRLSAAGLFPHQLGKHGPVRADADHRRRRSLGALRRRLHGPDVQHRKPALGRGRNHRQAECPLPLHDDPELVEQRLQPGHQAGRRLRRLGDGMGRRQPGHPARR